MTLKEAMCEVLGVFKEMGKDDYTLLGACMIVSTILTCTIVGLLIFTVYLCGGL